MTYPRREGLPLLSSDVQPQQQEGVGSGSKGVGSKEAVAALALCTLKVSKTMSWSCVYDGDACRSMCVLSKATLYTRLTCSALRCRWRRQGKLYRAC